MKKTTVVYGAVLALLAIVLKTIEYKWLMREMSWHIYVVLIAVFFAALGAWLAHQLLAKPRDHAFQRNDAAIKSLGLSEREIEVLQEAGKGHSNNMIAKDLFISVNTVKTHLKNAFDKLDVHNRMSAIAKLKSLKIIEK